MLLVPVPAGSGAKPALLRADTLNGWGVKHLDLMIIGSARARRGEPRAHGGFCDVSNADVAGRVVVDTCLLGQQAMFTSSLNLTLGILGMPLTNDKKRL